MKTIQINCLVGTSEQRQITFEHSYEKGSLVITGEIGSGIQSITLNFDPEDIYTHFDDFGMMQTAIQTFQEYLSVLLQDFRDELEDRGTYL